MYSLGIYLMALGVRVAALFKEKLRTIYHTRISYPELKTKNN